MYFNFIIKKRGIILFFILILIIILFYAFYRFYKKTTALCQDCNVILVALDTLSANHLPCYGYERNTSPNLCEYAKKNILFENAFSNASWTLPSDVSLFTGLLPSDHRVNLTNDRLKETLPFLPEILHNQGYTTIFSIPKNNPAVPPKTVYYKGIDKILHQKSPNEYQGDELKIFKENIKNGKKTFMFIYNSKVHHPYLIEDEVQLYPAKKIADLPLKSSQVYKSNFPAEFIKYLESQLITDYKSGSEIKGVLSNKDIFLQLSNDFEKSSSLEEKIELVNKFDKKNPNVLSDYASFFNWLNKIDKNNPEHVNYIKALYDQTINILDSSLVSDVINLMRDEKVSKKTVLVFYAEHGEEFMEHNNILHESLYDSNLHVPLIIYIPGINNRRVEDPVQLLDIMPTLLDVLGIKFDYAFRGESLIDAILGKTNKNRVLIADGYNLTNKVVRTDGWKVHLYYEKGQLLPYELYDLKNDPDEKKDLIKSKFDTAKELLKKYDEFSKN